jgi:acyl dehydratase
MSERTLAEFTELEGAEFAPTDWILIDQARIDAHARTTGDDQFIHTDPERAAATPMGGTIAQGFLLLALLGGHPPPDMPWPSDMAFALNYGTNKVRFLTPVRAGQRVRIATRVLSIAEKEPGRFLLTLEKRVEIDGVRSPALVAEMLALLVRH